MKRLLAILLLVPHLVWGAHDFDGTTGKAANGVVEVTAAPFTMACWFNSDSDAAGQVALGITDTASANDIFAIDISGNTGGDPVRAFATRLSDGVAVSTSGYTAVTWHHLAGVFTSATSRAVLLDGANKGTDATNLTPTSLDTTAIGVLDRLSDGSFFDGRIAECAIWNAALTDDEVATLAKGFAPPCVRRSNLIAYYPLIRDATSLKDLFSATANNLTLAGTTAVADHPRVINCQ